MLAVLVFLLATGWQAPPVIEMNSSVNESNKIGNLTADMRMALHSLDKMRRGGVARMLKFHLRGNVARIITRARAKAEGHLFTNSAPFAY